MKKLKITVFSFSFQVQTEDPDIIRCVREMCGRLRTYQDVYIKQKKATVRVMDKEYYFYDKKTGCYIFSKTYLKNFILLIKQYTTREELDISNYLNKKAKPLNLRFNPSIKLRDYQIDYVKALVDYDSPSMLMVDLRTGHGKTCIAMKAITTINLRTAILILPKYIDKWIDDVKHYTNVKDDEIFIVQGGDSLTWLMNNPGKNYKFIIFSMATIRNYITDYESNDFFEGVTPYELLPHLGIGVVLNDESHLHFHSLFKTSLLFNAYKLIGLSATFTTNQPDIERMYNIMFPTESRISNLVKYDNYINVVAITYKINDIRGLKWKTPQGYNHNLFEQSIMRRRVLLLEYMSMIKYYVNEAYLSKRRPGDKLLIFGASIKFCTLLTNYLARTLPRLDVRRYVEQDPYENVMNADICITTVLSAGTAIDIPNLIAVIQTVSISSKQSNQQSVGRLRRLKDREVYFYYLYTPDISNQIKLHRDREEAIGNVTKSYVFDTYRSKLTNR